MDKQILVDYEDVSSSCDCRECIKLCEDRPCWPTPDEADRLLDLGYASSLMRDYWVGEPNIYIICPASHTNSGKPAPFTIGAMCIFLSKDGLCNIHDSGAKPLEGRVALGCGPPVPNIHEDVAMSWDTDRGRDVVARWEELVNCSPETPQVGIGDMLDITLGFK